MSALVFGSPEAQAVLIADRAAAAKAKREEEVARALKGVTLNWYRVGARIDARCDVVAASARDAEKIAADYGDWEMDSGDVDIDHVDRVPFPVTPADAERYAIEHAGLKRVREVSEILATSGGTA